MSPELAKAAMQFLLRVQLQGAEVPAFNAIMESLRHLADPTEKTPPDRPED